MNAPDESSAAWRLEKGFHLGTLNIDPGSGEAGGPGGIEKLDPKVMGVLVMLAQNAGKLVTRAELLERLWPGVIVTDEALSRCIYELRRQLSLAAGDEHLKDAIETLPKRGYRLNLEIVPRVIEAPPAPRAAQRRWTTLTLAGIAAVIVLVIAWRGMHSPATAPAPTGSAGYSIAVLPFVDMSPGKDQAYLADGLAEEILNRLAQAKALRVIARTSSFAQRDAGLDVSEIARRLQVSHVLEGSVRRSGETVRITVQLIAASDSSHIWSNTFDRKVSDLLAVQDEIAGAVVKALETAFSTRPVAPSPAVAEAYEAFLQAQFFYHRRAPGDIQRAIGHYEQAVEIDPRFARAWANLAGAYSLLGYGESGQGPAELVAKQKQAALRAVELAPDLAIAHARLAQYYNEAGEKAKARVHRARARALDPHEPLVLADAISDAIGRGDLATAIALQEGVVARDPLAGTARQLLAVYLLADSQYKSALTEFRKVQDIHPDRDAGIAREIAPVLVLLGRFDEAEKEAARLPAGKHRDQAMALVYAATGRQREADATIARLEQSQEEIFDTIRLVEVYAYRGEVDLAFSSLDRKRQALLREYGPASGHIWYLRHEARLSPFLKVLHRDSRWAEFLAGPQSDVTG
jgi:TolB-like protein/DNA-binding winged helix-turn-helix (wHTH) protein/Flp pilus assembly protein TadD